MTKKLGAALILFFSLNTINAQTTETLVSNPVIHDGIYVDPTGNIYTTSGGLTGSDHIGKYDIQTEEFTPVWADGFAGPINIAAYRDSLLIVSNYDDNTVSALNLNTMEVEVIASNLDGPSGIAIDENDNIYITNWGQAPAWLGTEIYKIDSEGNVSLLIDDPALENPQAICINQDGDIVVHSNAWLYKVDPESGEMNQWTFLGITVPNITFRESDQSIYAVGNNKVLKIDSEGQMSIVSGADAGYQDGSFEEALYTDAIGVAFNPEDDVLYVSESAYQTGLGRLRALSFNSTTNLMEYEPSEIDLRLSPNVGTAFFVAEFPGNVGQMTVYEFTGRVVEQQNIHPNLQVDVSNWTPGAYLVHIQTDKGSAVRRFIKK